VKNAKSGLGLIIAGGLLVGIGLGLVQAGIRRSQACVECEEEKTEVLEVVEVKEETE